MSVSSVSIAASAISTAASSYLQQNSSSSSNSSALQEATETPTVTAQEAAKGDAVAKRLLAKQAQEKSLTSPSPTPRAQEPGKGEQIDQQA